MPQVVNVIGYGSAIGFKGGWEYNRHYNADQIIRVIDYYRKTYKRNL